MSVTMRVVVCLFLLMKYPEGEQTKLFASINVEVTSLRYN